MSFHFLLWARKNKIIDFDSGWLILIYNEGKFSSVQLLSRVRLLATPWITARQASLSITNSRSSLRLTSIESVMPSSHLILCRPLLLLPLIWCPSIRTFSKESIMKASKQTNKKTTVYLLKERGNRLEMNSSLSTGKCPQTHSFSLPLFAWLEKTMRASFCPFDPFSQWPWHTWKYFMITRLTVINPSKSGLVNGWWEQIPSLRLELG